jgi:hypothetical protein
MGVVYLQFAASLARLQGLQKAFHSSSTRTLSLLPLCFNDSAQSSVHRNLHVQEAVWFLVA